MESKTGVLRQSANREKTQYQSNKLSFCNRLIHTKKFYRRCKCKEPNYINPRDERCKSVANALLVILVEEAEAFLKGGELVITEI